MSDSGAGETAGASRSTRQRRRNAVTRLIEAAEAALAAGKIEPAVVLITNALEYTLREISEARIGKREGVDANLISLADRCRDVTGPTMAERIVRYAGIRNAIVFGPKGQAPVPAKAEVEESLGSLRELARMYLVME